MLFSAPLISGSISLADTSKFCTPFGVSQDLNKRGTGTQLKEPLVLSKVHEFCMIFVRGQFLGTCTWFLFSTTTGGDMVLANLYNCFRLMYRRQVTSKGLGTWAALN